MPRSTARALLAFSLAAATILASGPIAARAQLVADQPLTLEDTIAMALKKNFDLQMQAISNESQKESVNIARAVFDPTLTASITRNLSQQASNTSRLDGAQTQGPRSDNTTWRLGVSQLLGATNGTVSVSTNLTRAATNTTNALFNPQFGNGISVNLDQPLLRNAGSAAAKSNLERTKLGVTIANFNYTSQVLSLIASIESAYYNLVASRETLHIRQSSLELAVNLFEENKVKRATGTMIDLDVSSAELGVARARGTLVQAEQSVRDAEDNLLNLLNAGDYSVRPGPVKFENYTEGAPSFDTAYKLARDHYPQTQTQTETLKQLQIDLDTAKRNLLSDLRLTGSLGYTAKATNVGYGEAVSNLPDQHGNNWSLGLNYTLPWGRRADNARYRQAQLAFTSNKLRFDQLEQDLIRLVRVAVRTVETNLIAVEIAAQASALSEKQYAQQKSRFDAGLSTSRLVLQAQDDLEATRNTELNAKLTLRRAATELNRLQGTSLQRYRVQLPQ